MRGDQGTGRWRRREDRGVDRLVILVEPEAKEVELLGRAALRRPRSSKAGPALLLEPSIALGKGGSCRLEGP